MKPYPDGLVDDIRAQIAQSEEAPRERINSVLICRTRGRREPRALYHWDWSS